jgi:hypothetical protein
MADKFIDKKLANEFGKDYVKIMVAMLKGNKPYPKVASGSLINSINYRLQDTANGINVILLANDYLKYVDEGRKPSTNPDSKPPIQAILRWTNIKGIPQEAAWAIRNNIWRFGIKPTRVIDKTIRAIQLSRNTNRIYEQRMVDNIVKIIEKSWYDSADFQRLNQNQ